MCPTPCARIVVASFEVEPLRGENLDDDMTKPFSVAFKHKMVQRLAGKNAVSASQLAREMGLR